MPVKNDINAFVFDTAVIGAGPAGLSAAIRARFVKSRGAYPMSAVVFDSSETAGGLANFSNTKITGPSFQLERGELVSKLMKDVELFDIPIIHDKVIEIKKSRSGEAFTIKSASGGKYSAKSVIIATGMKPLSNEIEYFNNGVEITYMGFDFINKMITEFINDAAQNDKKFIIYGNKYSLNLINFAISAINGLKGEFSKMSPLFLIDAAENEIIGNKVYKKYPFLFSFGKIIKFSGAGNLNKITIDSGGRLRHEKVDRVLLDYSSFELAPDFNIKISPAVNILSKNGFIRADIAARTKIKGLFAAGDITGPYYSVSRAISAGITAAFSAYEYVMSSKKSVKHYSLFAYKSYNFTPDINYHEINIDLSKDKTPVISRTDKIKKILSAKFNKLNKSDLNKLSGYFCQYNVIAGDDFEEISKILNISVIELSSLIKVMIDEKLLGIE